MNRLSLAIGLLLLMALTACKKRETITWEPASNTSNASSAEAAATANDIIHNDEDFVENTTFSDQVITIVYSGTSATVTNPWEGNGVAISNLNGNVVCTSTADERIEYQISGSGSGSLKIYSEKKVKLSLNNLTLTSANGPALNLQGKKRQFVVLSGENSLTGKGYDTADNEEQAKAALFGEGQLIFSGDGSLTVTSTGKHGIASDDYVRINTGTVTISASGSSCADGIHTNDGFILYGGEVSVTAYDEAIQAGDDDDAGYCYLVGGSLTATAQNGDGVRSYGPTILYEATVGITASKNEGLESKSQILINGGQLEITAYDDGINAASLLTINGGWVYAQSANNDAIDSNGNIVISGGVIVAIGSRDPETAFDVDEGTLTVSGGTLLGVSPNNNMFVCPTTSSTQYSVWTSATAGTSYNLANSSHAEAMNFTLPSTSFTPKILISSPEITSGSNTLTTGVTISGGTNWHGLYIGATHSGGSSSATVSASLGSDSNTGGFPGGGPGGGPGGRP
ncbi:MAG: carbohydrate-binding domain-containing protein [Paludibacteraceae bacterium]|nr:carbohydrate-binding domain-containing protein [Paludibacteraceae bacterium]